jgi:tripartite-type tricarboxylate transporter receptor subunit TctC
MKKKPWAAAALLLVIAPLVPAQTFPEKPIRLVSPFSAGSATDFFARIIGPKLTESWGQPVVVDNRPAAGGVVAGEIVARATADGHVLLVHSGAFAASASLYSRLPFDTVKDFSGVTQVAANPMVLVVVPTSSIKSVKDLIAIAKQRPGQMNYGSAGIGSGTHYAAELFCLTAGIKVVHIPYKGTPEFINDTIAGRLQFALSAMPPAVPLINAGRLVPLATTSKKRSHLLPNIPTVIESSGLDYDYDGWFGVFAPSATPRRIVNQLAREISRIVLLPDVAEAFMKQGAMPTISSSPEAFDKMVHTEITTRRKVWLQAGVKPE